MLQKFPTGWGWTGRFRQAKNSELRMGVEVQAGRKR